MDFAGHPFLRRTCLRRNCGSVERLRWSLSGIQVHLDQPVQLTRRGEIGHVIAGDYSVSSTFWTGDASPDPTAPCQASQTLPAVDMFTGKSLWVLEDVQAERTGHLSL